MIRSIIITTIIFIRLASSGPLPLLNIREGSTLTELGETSKPEVESKAAFGLSTYENQRGLNLNHVIPDLDRSHVERVFGSNRDDLFFWDNDSSRSNTHVSWPGMDEMKRKRGRLGIIQKVKIIQVDCKVLREDLEYDEELKAIEIKYDGQSAHDTLKIHLESFQNVLRGLFDPHKQEPWVLKKPIHRLDNQMKWDVLLKYSAESFRELGDILLDLNCDFHYVRQSPKTEQIQTLTAKVFEILNIFIRNNLLDEERLQHWVDRVETKKLISRHIIDQFDESKFLGLDFYESLLKSKSTEDLAYFLKYLNRDDFKLVEYGNLKRKFRYVKETWGASDNNIGDEASHFFTVGFERNDCTNEEDRRNTLADITMVFDVLLYFPGSGMVSEIYYLTAGILYNVLQFIMRYHPSLFHKVLVSDHNIQSFNIKIMILDSATRYLKSAQELEFITKNGFWTSDIFFGSSKNHISLEQAQSWSPTWQKELEDFTRGFMGCTPKDFHKWIKIFKTSSIERRKYLNNPLARSDLECVTQKYEFSEFLEFFGTNFKLEDKDGMETKQCEHHLEEVPRISKVVLADIYSWMGRLQSVLKRHKMNMGIWKEISIRLKLGGEKGIPLEVQDDVRHWFENSFIPSFIDCEASVAYNKAEERWDMIRRNFEILNKTAFSILDQSGQKGSVDSPSKENLEKMRVQAGTLDEDDHQGLPGQNFKLKRHDVIKIPNIQF